MTEPLQDALIEIANVVANVPGVRAAYPYPQDQQNEYPFVSIYVSSGNKAMGAIGTRKSLSNINLDLTTNRMNLAADMEILIPFLDTLPAALESEVSGDGARFNGTISTFEITNYVFVPTLEYSKIPCIAYRFTMQNVKILSNT